LPRGFLLAESDDGNDPVKHKQPSPSQISSSIPSPVYIKVQVNNISQNDIVATESCNTIIHQNLLKILHDKKILFKRKSYQSASSTSVDIIGDNELEVKINGYKTFIIADVT